MTLKNKHILLVFRKAPYGNSLAREALDIALAMAAFDQKLTVVFIGDGVWQLLKNQNSELLLTKNHGKVCSALALYDINDIHVEAESMQQKNLCASDLIVDVSISNKSSLTTLMEQSNITLNF